MANKKFQLPTYWNICLFPGLNYFSFGFYHYREPENKDFELLFKNDHEGHLGGSVG